MWEYCSPLLRGILYYRRISNSDIRRASTFNWSDRSCVFAAERTMLWCHIKFWRDIIYSGNKMLKFLRHCASSNLSMCVHDTYYIILFERNNHRQILLNLLFSGSQLVWIDSKVVHVKQMMFSWGFCLLQVYLYRCLPKNTMRTFGEFKSSQKANVPSKLMFSSCWWQYLRISKWMAEIKAEQNLFDQQCWASMWNISELVSA